MKEIDYFRFDNIGETLDFMSRHNEGIKVIAGGTDLVIELRKNSRKLDCVERIVDISRLPVLKGISMNGNYLEIGACETHTSIAENPVVLSKLPVLSQACSLLGCLQTRNVGTIGGNICNASPSADTVPVLYAMGAEMIISRANGEERRIPVSEMISAPYRITIHPSEILEKIVIPIPSGELKCAFEKVGRRNALSITRISVSAVCVLENGRISDMRIVPGAVLPVWRRIKQAEDFLNGKIPEKKIFAEAAAILAKDVFDEVGERWSSPYKKPVLEKTACAAFCRMFGINII